jgi:hypothetical protein
MGITAITAVTADDIPALVPLVNSAYRGGEGPRGWTDEAHLLDGPRTDAAAVEHAWKHGYSTIRITVISARTELVAWYERHGYRRTGETEPFHSGGKFGVEKRPLELVVLEREV